MNEETWTTPDWYMTTREFGRLVDMVATRTSRTLGLRNGPCHPVDLAAHWSMTAELVGEVLEALNSDEYRNADQP